MMDYDLNQGPKLEAAKREENVSCDVTVSFKLPHTFIWELKFPTDFQATLATTVWIDSHFSATEEVPRGSVMLSPKFTNNPISDHTMNLK